LGLLLLAHEGVGQMNPCLTLARRHCDSAQPLIPNPLALTPENSIQFVFGNSGVVSRAAFSKVKTTVPCSSTNSAFGNPWEFCRKTPLNGVLCLGTNRFGVGSSDQLTARSGGLRGFALAHQPVQSLFPPLINAWLSISRRRRLIAGGRPFAPRTRITRLGTASATAPRGIWRMLPSFSNSCALAIKNLRADQAGAGRRSGRRVRQAFSSEQAETPIPESDNAVTC